jgi:ribulose-phosphate 3-epimerase
MRLGEEIELVEKLGLKWLHLDHMDGHFTPNISFGPDFVRAIRKKTDLFLDVHLMFTNPMDYIDTYKKAGADSITIHVEADDEPRMVIDRIRENGLKVGISLNPHTSPEKIRHLLPYVDMVLVMTVEPGFGGQSLIPECLDKVRAIRRYARSKGMDIKLEVDGGIGEDNVSYCTEAGANILVAGSSLFKTKRPRSVMAAMREAGVEHPFIG